MEYGTRFKKALFGGFDREDVLRCFEEMNAKNTEELEEERAARKKAEQKLAAASDRANALEKDKEELTSSLDTCRAALEEAQRVNEEQRRRLEQLQQELKSLRALNSELSVKRSILEENNRSLKQKVEELEASASNEKAGLEISEMMLEAKKTADNITARANEKAAAAEETIRERSSWFDGMLEDFRGKTAVMRETLSKTAQEIGDHLFGIEQEAEKTAAMMEDKPQEPAAEEKPETKEPEGEPAKPDQKPAEDREKNPYSFLFRK